MTTAPQKIGHAATDYDVDTVRRDFPVLDVGRCVGARPGRPDPQGAGVVIAAISRAVALIREGACSALVTAPIAKSVLYDAGFRFPGHTEYLGALAEKHWPIEKHWPEMPATPVMMPASPSLRVVLVTVHIPIAAVPEALSIERIVAVARVTDRSLRRDFAIAAPRLAVAGLNPHAGEGGSIGVEDRDIVAPAVAQLQGEAIAATGPHPADTLFHERARATYDAAICMYHDQANIAIKTLDFDRGVNTTLGLPFIRTSPDHGTAFDIAGKGVANPSSLIEAIRLARTMAANRRAEQAHSMATASGPTAAGTTAGT